MFNLSLDINFCGVCSLCLLGLAPNNYYPFYCRKVEVFLKVLLKSFKYAINQWSSFCDKYGYDMYNQWMNSNECAKGSKLKKSLASLARRHTIELSKIDINNSMKSAENVVAQNVVLRIYDNN